MLPFEGQVKPAWTTIAGGPINGGRPTAVTLRVTPRPHPDGRVESSGPASLRPLAALPQFPLSHAVRGVATGCRFKSRELGREAEDAEPVAGTQG